jgi:hypothetical protein
MTNIGLRDVWCLLQIYIFLLRLDVPQSIFEPIAGEWHKVISSWLPGQNSWMLRRHCVPFWPQITRHTALMYQCRAMDSAHGMHAVLACSDSESDDEGGQVLIWTGHCNPPNMVIGLKLSLWPSQWCMTSTHTSIISSLILMIEKPCQKTGKIPKTFGVQRVNAMLGLIFRWKIDIIGPVVLLLATPTNLQHCPCSLPSLKNGVNAFMLGLLGEGGGVKPNSNIVRIVMQIGILGRSLTLTMLFYVGTFLSLILQCRNRCQNKLM